MKRKYGVLKTWLPGFASAGIVLLVSSCGSGSADSSNSNSNPPVIIPLGAEVSGVTLAGPLAGKKAYALDSTVNIPDCWMDSVNWTGSELFYGLSSANFTLLLAGQGLVREPGCILPRAQAGGDYFDTYKAKIVNGAWQVFDQHIDLVSSDAGASVSGSTMAYTVYNPSGDWDLYLTDKVTDNVWSTPVAFERNSTCPEDNAQVYANGTKIIFESTRTDGTGSACDADPNKKSLWFSQKTGSSWSVPVLIPGDPNVGDKNTQPWVDEINGYLYWTADTECACIRRIAWVNDTPVGNFETVLTPAVQTLSQGTADGKIIFSGEYSQSADYAFFSCAKAANSGDGTDPNLYLGRWKVNVSLCVIPLK